MRFAVEPWSPDYASPFDPDASPQATSDARVEAGVERPAAAWEPIRPSAEPSRRPVVFVDGVQRVDAWVYTADGDGVERPGICASYAAGIVRCDDRAVVEAVEVRRGLFSPAPGEPIRTRSVVYEPRATAGSSGDDLRHAVQQRMGELEAELARRVRDAALVVVDGPLGGRQDVPGAIGYVKTHHVRYLADEALGVVARIAPGERTPLFLLTTSWSRYSWYLRLPGAGGHDWAGVARCEAAADLAPADAARLADAATATLQRFASQPHKDPRAPQNLHPIGGLERELRRRLGDGRLLYRELLVAAGLSDRAAPA